jgi:glycopeptidolipid biosynthesis protein
MNPHDDGIGPDEYVDWLVDAGLPIKRIDDFGEWLHRFETALGALPEKQREHSVLQMLQLRPSGHFDLPEPMQGSWAPTDRFRSAFKEAKFTLDRDISDIPHVTAPVIMKYVTDLRRFGLL